MKVDIYHVDAFTDKLFSGNPAAVCVLSTWIAEEKLRLIAVENNLPVTAFIVRDADTFSIRWITPDYELDLCGHGTLSAAFVIFNYIEPAAEKINFTSKAGLLKVHRNHKLITLNFPVKTIETYALPDALSKGLQSIPKELYKHKNERLLVVFDNENQVKNLRPDLEILKKLDHRGIVVTAPSETVDFVSRTFYPWKGISEDPVTGASHCMLVPYWANRLRKNNLVARQVSERGGEIKCEYKGDHVLLSSQAVLYSQGVVFLE